MNHDEVRDWFAQAVSMPAGQRTAFLEENCPSATTRKEVAALLEFDSEESDSDSGFRLPGEIRKSIRTAVRGPFGGAPTQQVGPFVLGRLLGSGGMGLVYEGERVDGAVHQRVAVKFAQVPATASQPFRDRVYRRFYREREILAQLRHPYIAALIDAGTTRDGIPYAVIEQVNGMPVDEYCDNYLPDRTDRIRLVLKLCDAVQFAHTQLIVHADIKPDNILVTPDGLPKLIDFGVATEISDDGTLTSTRAFTPSYASPEQWRGQAATVATDVYGIGAVLYRLLTGARPRDLQTLSLAKAARGVMEEEVARPSLVKPELRGDLENILLKALQPEAARRYLSVAELAADLNRYLACRPVLASPDSTLYRFKRFVRRRWALLTFGALLLASLSAAVVMSYLQRDQALRHAAETRRLAQTLLFEVHDEIGGMVVGAKAREKLGAIAVEFLESLGRKNPGDPELAWELLGGYARLAQSRGGGASSIGDTGGATQLAKKALMLGALVEAAAPDPNRLDQLFQVYESLAGIFEEAEQMRERKECMDRMHRLAAGLRPLRQAQAGKQMARYLEDAGQSREAVQEFEKTIAILRELTAAAPQSGQVEADLVGALTSLSRAQANSADLSGAVASLESAIGLAEQIAAKNPSSTRNRRQLYWSHLYLGDMLGLPLRFNLGRRDEALEQYRRAIAIGEALVAADPANDSAKVDLARALGRAGVTLAEADPATALDLMKRAEGWTLQTSKRNQSGLDYRLATLTSSVAPLVRLGQKEQARQNVAEARRVLERMRQAGMEASEKPVLKAEAIQLFAEGRAADAVAVAKRHLALLPNGPKLTLSQACEMLEVLERLEAYGAKGDRAAQEFARERIAEVWRGLRVEYPDSEYVRERALY